ncbi:hypothetical protein [Nonomuraea soli]|uniref:Integral membrane protein n=1 Tax=Nonomuraea soli TaxID=1032476 RepID=A0A7W0CNC3_9ACTN|nr:hypothetical protein [Nonomuraea soli]MBA2894258.1 hypothetical protein [Nonomuraea soli]
MRRPVSLLVAAAVVALEGVIALALGGFVAVNTLLGEATVVTTALAEAAFGLGLGAGLLWVAYGGLLKAERWGRAPGVLAQIFLIPVAGTVLMERPAIGVPLIVIALAGLVALLAPSTTQALYGD